MKKRNQKYLIVLVLIALILLTILVIKIPSLSVSSCTTLSGLEVYEATRLPDDAVIYSGECPTEAIPETIQPQQPNSNSGSSSSGGGYAEESSSSNSNQKPNNNTINTTDSVKLSPPITEQNNTENQSILVDAAVKEFISANNLDIECNTYTEFIEKDTYLTIIKGERKTSLLKIKIPLEAKLVIHQGKPILSCVKQPWWGTFFK
jgi:hypothetical protein